MTSKKTREQGTKMCASNSCSNPGTHQLTILYVNKIGWFCDKCKNELEQEGLVTESVMKNGLSS